MNGCWEEVVQAMECQLTVKASQAVVVQVILVVLIVLGFGPLVI